ncbi:TolB family protein [Streptomyces rimosus]|uniref:TolB family protein n=1 Tax=Streptomyces rimosus TaxID=1927 RepID=UPI00311FF28D
MVAVGGLAAPAAAAGRTCTERISVTATGKLDDGRSSAPSLSADGRVVAFAYQATTFGPDSVKYRPQVFWKDLRRGALARVSGRDVSARTDTCADEGALSADGRHLAFEYVSYRDEVRQGRPDPIAFVYVRDLRSGRNVKANVGLDDGYGIVSARPSLTADGRYVAFVTDDTPWYPFPVPGEVRIYVTDFTEGVPRRVIAPPGYWAGDAADSKLSGAGRFLACRLYVS